MTKLLFFLLLATAHACWYKGLIYSASLSISSGQSSVHVYEDGLYIKDDNRGSACCRRHLGNVFSCRQWFSVYYVHAICNPQTNETQLSVLDEEKTLICHLYTFKEGTCTERNPIDCKKINYVGDNAVTAHQEEIFLTDGFLFHDTEENVIYTLQSISDYEYEFSIRTSRYHYRYRCDEYGDCESFHKTDYLCKIEIEVHCDGKRTTDFTVIDGNPHTFINDGRFVEKWSCIEISDRKKRLLAALILL